MTTDRKWINVNTRLPNDTQNRATLRLRVGSKVMRGGYKPAAVCEAVDEVGFWFDEWGKEIIGVQYWRED